MASLAGILHRPLRAVVAVAIAAVSTELPDRFSNPKLSDSNTKLSPSSAVCQPVVSSAHRFSMSQMYFNNVPESLFRSFALPTASPAVLQAPYQYAKLVKPPDSDKNLVPTIPSSQSDLLYRWRLPDLKVYGTPTDDNCSNAKSNTVVILLGWLGAKQKHLKRYADWYTSRGFHAVTITLPMRDILSYKAGGKAEHDISLLAEHLAVWVTDEKGRNLVFHTFSNTGWLTYGLLLEKFQKQDPSVTRKIKGCIVDSAPVAAPDPQVWASGFSAALLKKQSVATKGTPNTDSSGTGDSVTAGSSTAPKLPVVESALLVILEKFFKVVLNFPAINGRLEDILGLLTSEQPKCPQLYIYSNADRVIPAKSVESFIERQQKAGHQVKACNFVSSPHVDHFRSHPDLYTSQLTNFLEDCVLTCCRNES